MENFIIILIMFGSCFLFFLPLWELLILWVLMFLTIIIVGFLNRIKEYLLIQTERINEKIEEMKIL